MRDAVLDRPGLSERLSNAMRGRDSGGGLPFKVRGETVKTFSVEVNSDGGSALEAAGALSERLGMRFAHTHDPDLAVLWDEGGALFADLLDDRFWLVHTVGPSRWAHSWLRRAVSGSRSLDWCWLTIDMLNRMRAEGEERWFKADFKGGQLLPADGTVGRRLRVQLEGDDPLDLQSVLAEAGYKSSTALTGVALRLRDSDLGSVDVASYYRGSFSARGDSFDVHLGFVSRVVNRYAAAVRQVERTACIDWTADESGANFRGEVVEIEFARPLDNLDYFLRGLFSCREPFRLWAVPRYVAEGHAEAEVVDLHVGQRFRMEVARSGLRLYLRQGGCGNTLFRLLANLQHRYDAAAVIPEHSRVAWSQAG